MFSTLLLALVVTAKPSHGKPFTVQMDDKDTIGSVYQCEDKLHKRTMRSLWTKHGTGVCVVPPGSLKAGKHMTLAPKYAGIFVDVSK